tara:strand:+ start:733 stop:1095 length:363 start_codon:yes stop_codon:yes gene_type:complete
MKIDFNLITRRFLMGEGKQEISPNALLQALSETLGSLRPSSRTDENRIAVAKKHIREITRSFRRLQEQVNVLEEQLQVLEEASSMGGGSVQGAMASGGGAWDESEVKEYNKEAKKRSGIK